MELNKILSDVETKFNIAGSIPLIAIISGGIRMVSAKIQVIAGALIGLIGLIGQMIHDQSKKWEQLTHKGLEQVVHGGLNFLRGFGEGLTGCTIIGSLGFFAAQSLSKNKFTPIIKYE